MFMDWIIFVSIVLCSFLLGLYIKHYFPSYFDEKGKNLATKEDIAEITRKTEEVQKEFREGFELFTSDIRFKYDFYYKQYSELYSKLYGIIIQSEYIRKFIKISDGKDLPFDDAPFVEMSPTHKITQTINLKEGQPVTVTQNEEIITTSISEFNKKKLCEYIIEKAEYASQSLLKLAISYRFSYFYYSGNDESRNTHLRETADKEEVRLIREMVCCIVREYNFFRKELKMEYNENELSTGIPEVS